ncbi:MAG: cytoplasmic protein [Candidatus Electrothrix sp. AU1_5]|nr:cytoplasmic protein [Candidatus Electrothrix gigas]MCI5190980.1 cytoplasmic protein [Candidatus Electrothrix gigas]MCI5193007.1 cytoplasmic protein [Candidatus Electrothrix gigas]
MKQQEKIPFHQICFGFNRELDEQSLALFLRLFSQEKLMDTLLPRLQEEEITGLVEQITELLHKHLAEQEYHELFLNDEHHSH